MSTAPWVGWTPVDVRIVEDTDTGYVGDGDRWAEGRLSHEAARVRWPVPDRDPRGDRRSHRRDDGLV